MGRTPPVPSAKVSPPRVQGLGRDRLNELLGRIWESRLGLVIAPAGSGKTTLLAQFAAASGVPVAWYRAEGADSSTEALLRHLKRSANGVLGNLPGDWTTIESVVAALERWAGKRALLVIDDLHALEGTEAEVALERLIEYAPPSLRMIVASRRPPGFNISRLRVSGDLLEVTSDDLRFRSWEVEQLFRNYYGQPMPPEDLAELARRTEGWAAGLQLFHLATHGKPPSERRKTLTSLGYGAKPVREYLTRNALEELGEEIREFMLQTSLLGRLSGPICDTFLETTGSGGVLQDLERRQIFTQPVDDFGNYRYHEVLRSHLEATLLDQIGEQEARRRFGRAAVLLEEAGAIPEALRAYSRAEDWEAAARLLGREGESLAEDPGEWIHSLPTTVLDHDPWLLLTKARRYFAAGRLQEARDTYRRAEMSFGPAEARDTCAREHRAVSIWLQIEQPLSNDWVSLARAATQRDPLGVAKRAAALEGDNARFVEGLATVLAGHVRAGRGILVELADKREVPPPLELAARFAAALSSRMGNRVGHIDEFEKVAEEAEVAGLPWLTRLARAARALGGGPDELAEARAMRDASKRAGDDWGAALAGLIEGIGRLWSGEDATVVLEASARTFEDLGAGVLQAWTKSLSALSFATSLDSRPAGAVEPTRVAAEAESLARTLGVPGARALALVALGSLGGARAAESLSLGTALAAECGLRADLKTLPASFVHKTAQLLTVKCFGHFSIEVGGEPVQLTEVKPKAREVLKILAINAGRPVHRDLLMEASWHDADSESATKGLHVVLSSLRRLLEQGTGRGSSRLILREGDAYRLAIPEAGECDVATFNTELAEGRRARANGDFRTAVTRLRGALDIYQGDLLPEVGPAEWVLELREYYVSAAAETAQLLATTLLEQDEAGEAASVAERGLQIDRYRDGLWRLLIESLDHAGDRAAAARARHSYKAALEELGVLGE